MKYQGWPAKFPNVFSLIQKSPLARQLSRNQWIFLAFEQKLITEMDYLTWAQAYYGLALFNPQGFYSQSFLDTYKSVKDFYPWGPHALPVKEWDDVLFVACVEPENVPVEFTKGETRNPGPNSDPSRIPRLIRPILASPSSLIKAWNELNHSLTPSDLPLNPKENTPVALDLNPIPEKAVPLEVLTEELLEIPMAKAKPEAPISQPISIPFSEMPQPPPAPPISKADSLLDEELTSCFARAYQSFRTLMILRTTDHSAWPMKWDKSFKINGIFHEPQEIKLDDPSIFRLVYKTQKPFHGPVSPSTINNNFFDQWFGGVPPLHVSMVPLRWNHQGIGLLFASATETVDPAEGLLLLEGTATMIVTVLGSRLAG